MALVVEYAHIVERSGRQDVSGSYAKDTWEIKYTAASDVPTPVDVMLAANLPALWTAYPGAPQLLLTAKDPKPTANRRFWLVECDYNSRGSVGIQSGQNDVNPLAQPARIQCRGERFTRPFDIDADGYSVLSSAHGLPDPTVEVDDSYSKIVIIRNVASWNWATANFYRNMLNLYALTLLGQTVDVAQGIIKTYDADRLLWNNTYYWEETLEILIAKQGETWDKYILDRDIYYLDGGVKKRIQIGSPAKDADDPQLLNGSGGVLAVGGTPVYLYYPLPAVSWAGLSLPAAAV